MKVNVLQLRAEILAAETRHSESLADIRRIEKDINDFSNNKDRKLAELQSVVDSSKITQGQESFIVKTLHKELQAARLESEQSGGDLGAAQEQLTDMQHALKAQLYEIESLRKETTEAKVESPLESMCDSG